MNIYIILKRVKFFNQLISIFSYIFVYKAFIFEEDIENPKLKEIFSFTKIIRQIVYVDVFFRTIR